MRAARRIVGLDGEPLNPAEAGPQQVSLLDPPPPGERVKVAGGRRAGRKVSSSGGDQAAIQFEAGPFPVGQRWASVHQWCDAVSEAHAASILERFVLRELGQGAARDGEARMS
ncbi:MAG: hypothetical protein OXG72_13170, partial [Acidobacteria bacterium]|nr:hypothetical protein [Acidobacteriota bacterium]